jgi:hypothetical protein
LQYTESQSDFDVPLAGEYKISKLSNGSVKVQAQDMKREEIVKVKSVDEAMNEKVEKCSLIDNSKTGVVVTTEPKHVSGAGNCYGLCVII